MAASDNLNEDLFRGRPRASANTPAGERVLRGEIRSIFPTVEVPDPSAEPEKALRQHMAGGWHMPPSMRINRANARGPEANNTNESVGQHWTRLRDPNWGSGGWRGENESRAWIEAHGMKQTGVPMSDSERRGIVLNDYTEHYKSRRARPDSYNAALEELDGARKYRGFGGDGQAGSSNPSPSAARPFTAKILWHGLHNPESVGEHDRRSSYSENEIIYQPGSKLHVVGADIQIPPHGQDFGSVYDRGIFQRIQFDEPMEVTISDQDKSIGRQIHMRIRDAERFR